MSTKGLLIILSGPSGAGKDTVLKELISISKDIKLSVSATTRAPREGETNLKDYIFLKEDEFLKLVSNKGMLEYVEYCGNFYGTPKRQVLKWINQGKDVILKIEVKGCKKVKQENPSAVSIFISPPSFLVLEQRLKKRNTENEGILQERLDTAKEEMKESVNYDYIVLNESIENCAQDILNIINIEKCKNKYALDHALQRKYLE